VLPNPEHVPEVTVTTPSVPAGAEPSPEPRPLPAPAGEAAGGAAGGDAPGGAPQAATRPRSHRRAIGLAVVAVLVIGAVTAAAFVRLPYYLLAPGALRPTEAAIAISGVPVYPGDDGEIGYITATFSQARPLSLVRGWLDGDIEVLDADVALGGLSRDENRQVNVQLMDNAKATATFVALQALGYDVEIFGSGAGITQVVEGSPADGVLAPGDIVVSVDGEPVTTSGELTDAMAGAVPGEAIVLGVERHSADGPVVGPPAGTGDGAPDGPDARVESVTVIPVARTDDPDRALLGVVSVTTDITYGFPFEVDIESGSVIGPSAGLAFALAMVDLLTPGSLTGDDVVAVTGRILPDGNVARVGGVPQKVAAAIASGAQVFVVPVVDVEVARERAGDDLEVIGVESFEEALVALAERSGDTSVLDAVAA